MTYEVVVPPTFNMGSYTAICRDHSTITYKEDALIDYNLARGHDCLIPLKSMPQGTTYIKIKGE